MSNPFLEPGILIKRLSHRPRHLLNCMIRIDKPKPQGPPLAFRVSSIGTLDCFPLEIISIILGALDIQSIARFACVSFQGSLLVLSQHQYRDLLKFAPEALLALGRTGLAHWYPVERLHSTLRSQQCTACTAYGAYLFLPTCKRCCWQCLSEHPWFQMLWPDDAELCGGLPARLLRDPRLIPPFHVMPDNYRKADEHEPDEIATAGTGPYTLFSASRVGSLAFAVNGRSRERFWAAIREKCNSGTRLFDKAIYLFWTKGVFPRVNDDLLFRPLFFRSTNPEDDFFGLASIPFPSLSSSGKLEHGLWCQGCEITLRHYRMELLSEHALESLWPRCWGGQERVVAGLERRAYSEAGFLNHITQCYGARQLVPDLGSGKSKVG